MRMPLRLLLLFHFFCKSETDTEKHRKTEKKKKKREEREKRETDCLLRKVAMAAAPLLHRACIFACSFFLILRLSPLILHSLHLIPLPPSLQDDYAILSHRYTVSFLAGLSAIAMAIFFLGLDHDGNSALAEQTDDSYAEDDRHAFSAEEGMDPSSPVFYSFLSEELADRREKAGVSVAAAEYEDEEEEEEASEARRNMDMDLDVLDSTKQVDLHMIPDKRNTTINEVSTSFDDYLSVSSSSSSSSSPPPTSTSTDYQNKNMIKLVSAMAKTKKSIKKKVSFALDVIDQIDDRHHTTANSSYPSSESSSSSPLDGHNNDEFSSESPRDLKYSAEIINFRAEKEHKSYYSTDSETNHYYIDTTESLELKNHKRNGRNTSLNQAKSGGYTDMNQEKSGGYNELQSQADAFIARFKGNLLTGERNWEGNLNQNKQLYRGFTLVAN